MNSNGFDVARGTTVVQGDNDEPPLGFEETQLGRNFYKVKTNRVGDVSTCSQTQPRTTNINPTTSLFKKKYYRHIPAKLWNSWEWQISNRIRDIDTIKKFIPLTDNEISAFTERTSEFGIIPFAVTPYYLSLINPESSEDPIRKSVIPTSLEFVKSFGEEEDPLHEHNDEKGVHNVVHRYPDRVLFLVSNFCSVVCRYCTRSRMFRTNETNSLKRDWERGLEYIRSNSAIRDVLLSGGDPLCMPTDRLDWLLKELRSIEHVEMIRIGTKVPAVMPQRITKELVSTLKKYHPLFMSLHFTHPNELTLESINACNMLADAGIPLGSQTVLLKGINDSSETMKDLFHGLLKARVKPYYLYQCDPIIGSSHFRTSVSTGIDIIDGLRGHTSGYAIPSYVIDAPGGGGKIPLQPAYVQGRDSDGIILRNYLNKTYKYPDFE